MIFQSMGSKICMNASCGATATHEWKRGWPLRSGGYAHLCYSCGSAFENSVYCDTFHLGESGWRECRMCSKRLHCGCIASKSVFELLDYGGVGCTSCVKSSQLHSVQSDELPNGFGSLTINNACKLESSARLENRLVGDGNDGGKLVQLSRRTETNEPCQSEGDDTNSCFGPFREDFMHGIREAGPGFSNVIQPLVGSSKFTKPDNIRSMLEMRDIHGSLAQPSLSMTLGGPSSSRNFVPFSSGAVERREQANAPSSLQQGQKSRPILPKPSKPGFAMSSETNKVVVSEMRIARPPGEGRGKNQLLPRYWPRITDQELQQLSGDLNSTIVPLFEKVLSASDAGRIGRLVLPKACAEAYFPPISQSEGLPLRIQDVKGREWTFQFRFWPNNNSRMYVLEGVTPCIQSMQLQAGDTITFSRIDPGGKLVVGFRKATNNSLDTPDAEASIFPNGSTSGETSFSGTVETLCTDGDVGCNKSESPGARINGDLRPAVTTEKKRTRNIGPKSKRLLMHSEDAMELRLTWEEAQDLLRPPPSAMPSIVTIEDHEIEEYDEPPVFGKKTIFTARPSGGREQWAQCDDCSKWRKLPLDALLPPKWTCSDNVWDSSRCTCAASQEMSLKDLDNLLRLSKDFKRQKIMESHKPLDEIEPTGLDALASAAVLGESIGDLGEKSVGATTKHPRHRDGCSCIVCIQPPSGKGKHKPTCTCNVCLTVKRRFKTLMQRKKKRQLEREAETAQKEINERKERIAEDSRKGKDESEMNDTLGHETLHINNPGNEGSQSRNQPVSEISTGQIDLNADPNRDDGHLGAPELSTMNLADAPNLPFDSYAKQSGIPNLMCEQASLSLRRLSDEAFLASVGWDHESRRD